MKPFSALLVLLWLSSLTMAQTEDPEGMVRYTPGYEFPDGIYFNFEMVKSGEPIPPARVVTDVDLFDREFYEKITSASEIIIYDENGVKKVIDTDKIWGYGRNGVLYINVASSFHRISLVGSISHFVASVTTYNPNYYDPYAYNPYYSNTDLRQYLLDFDTGEIMEYNSESVEVMLMKDPELADEFLALRGRKRKQMKFVFIRRYNEKHPLYFPAR